MASNETADRAAELLHSPPVDVIADSLIRRCLLEDGRFESHEFGRHQHSSASAGAVVSGLSGIPILGDDVVTPVVEAGYRLVSSDGRVRAHDEDPGAGDTTWSQAQILLGLLLRPHLVTGHPARLHALARNLLKVQEPDGGWALRDGEASTMLFSFYPALAIVRAHRNGLLPADEVTGALHRAFDYMEGFVLDTLAAPEDQLLAHTAARRLRDVSRGPGPSLPARGDNEFFRAYWSVETGLKLQDRATVLTGQPVWHSTMWRPLLYMCARIFAPPLNPVNCLLAAELLDGYDSRKLAWSGPRDRENRGTGSSWASALALRATVAVAEDLIRHEIPTENFTTRIDNLRSREYKYDVAISFAGQDRNVAEVIVRILQESGVRVFYDRDQQHSLLGEDLSTVLQSTYFDDSKYAVVLVSRAFIASRWAGNWEWKAVLARMQRQNSGYVLPYIMEDVELPGLSPNLGYVDARFFRPEDFAELVVRKLYG